MEDDEDSGSEYEQSGSTESEDDGTDESEGSGKGDEDDIIGEQLSQVQLYGYIKKYKHYLIIMQVDINAEHRKEESRRKGEKKDDEVCCILKLQICLFS